MEQHYQIIVRDTEERVLSSMSRQCMEKESPFYGSFADKDEIVQAKYTAYRGVSMISCYCCRDSRFYRSGKLYQRIEAALSYIEKAQHENGLFDYVTCNFFSAPDTAFITKKLLPTFEYLKSLTAPSEEEKRICEQLDKIIHKAAKGIAGGGFHTPNHRWAIASVLLKTWQIYGDPELRKRAEQYLAEGIDCNEDGEYSEKSAGNYNRINNDAMIAIGEVTGDPQYEEYVIRNLNMMLHYWEPDGSIFTANSTRYDKDRLTYPKNYYNEYMLMGERHHIPAFLQMCNRIMDICDDKGLLAPDLLNYYLLHPEWMQIEEAVSYHDEDYRAYYKNSGIARVHSKDYTFTVMKDKTDFLYFHDGTIKVAMKVAGSFVQYRAFSGDSMEEIPGGYHLHQTMRGWYYLPWTDEQRPDTSDWWQMDNDRRDKTEGPDMDIDVYVTESEQRDGVDVRVVTGGVDGAPWRIEIAVMGADFLQNENVAQYLRGGEAITIRKGMTRVQSDRDAIIIGPAFGEHHFMEGKEDSEGRMAGASTIYFTAYTGFDQTIQLRNVRTQLERENRL